MTPSPASDFDFLLGQWQVRNRRLKDCFVDSSEWIDFPARLEGSRKLLQGSAIMEQYLAEFDGEIFEGVSLRVFDPATNLWTIYWMDINHPVMAPQVVGGFDDGIGEFHGEEQYKGKPVRMRFIWSDITAHSARWEQAYLDENRNSWETNWVMEFTRDE